MAAVAAREQQKKKNEEKKKKNGQAAGRTKGLDDAHLKGIVHVFFCFFCFFFLSFFQLRQETISKEALVISILLFISCIPGPILCT